MWATLPTAQAMTVEAVTAATAVSVPPSTPDGRDLDMAVHLAMTVDNVNNQSGASCGWHG